VTGLLASWGGAVAGVSWAAFAFFFAVVLVGVSLTLVRVLEATRMIIESVRQETVPLLSEVTTTVRSVNKELERVDGLMESAGRIAQSAEDSRIDSFVTVLQQPKDGRHRPGGLQHRVASPSPREDVLQHHRAPADPLDR